MRRSLPPPLGRNSTRKEARTSPGCPQLGSPSAAVSASVAQSRVHWPGHRAMTLNSHCTTGSAKAYPTVIGACKIWTSGTHRSRTGEARHGVHLHARAQTGRVSSIPLITNVTPAATSRGHTLWASRQPYSPPTQQTMYASTTGRRNMAAAAAASSRIRATSYPSSEWLAPVLDEQARIPQRVIALAVRIISHKIALHLFR